MLLKEILYSLREDFKSQERKFIETDKVESQVVKKYIEDFKDIEKKYKNDDRVRNDDIPGLEVKKGHDRFDINKYQDFKQLEIFVDYVGRIKKVGKGYFDDIVVDGKPIAHGHGLEIYRADSKHACITYKGDKPYSWCISRKDSGNMYYTYRFKDYEPTFYFVKDIEQMEKEFAEPLEGDFKYPYHFFVIQVTKSPETPYIVTNANNDGDQEMSSWDDILDLDGVNQNLEYFKNLFVNIPLTARDKELKQKFEKDISDEEFKMFSVHDKEAYLDIAIPKFNLTDAKFYELPTDLKNKYIGYGLGLSDKMYEMIKNDKNLVKRFASITVRKAKEMYDDNADPRFTRPEYEMLFSYKEGLETLKDAKPSFIDYGLEKGISLTEFNDRLGTELLSTILFKDNPKRLVYKPQEYIKRIMAHIKTLDERKLMIELIRKNYNKPMSVESLFTNPFDSTYGRKNVLAVRDAEKEGSEFYEKMSEAYKRLIDAIEVARELNNGNLKMEDAQDILKISQKYLNSTQLNSIKKYLVGMVKGGKILDSEFTKGGVTRFIHDYIDATLDIDSMTDMFGEDATKKALLASSGFGNFIKIFSSPSGQNKQQVWDALKKMHQLIGTTKMIDKIKPEGLATILGEYTDPNNLEEVYQIFGKNITELILKEMGDSNKLKFLEHMATDRQNFFNAMVLLRNGEPGNYYILNYNYHDKDRPYVDDILETMQKYAHKFRISMTQMVDFFGPYLLSQLNNQTSSIKTLLMSYMPDLKNSAEMAELIYSKLNKNDEYRYTVSGKLLAWLLLTHPNPNEILRKYFNFVEPKNFFDVLEEFKSESSLAKDSTNTIRKRILDIIPRFQYEIQTKISLYTLETILENLTSSEDFPLFKFMANLKLKKIADSFRGEDGEILPVIVRILVSVFSQHFNEMFPTLKKAIEKSHITTLKHIQPEYLDMWAGPDGRQKFAELYDAVESALENKRKQQAGLSGTERYKLNPDGTRTSLGYTPRGNVQERHMVYKNYFI